MRPESQACPEGSETHEADSTGVLHHSCPCFDSTGNTCECYSGDAGLLLSEPPGAARSPGKLGFACALLLLHGGPGACCLVRGPGEGCRAGLGTHFTDSSRAADRWSRRGVKPHWPCEDAGQTQPESSPPAPGTPGEPAPQGTADHSFRSPAHVNRTPPLWRG